MDRSSFSRRQFIAQSLSTQLFVDKYPSDRVLRSRRQRRFDIWERILPARCSYLESLLFVIGFHRPNLHNNPAASSSFISSITRLGALPLIALLLSRSHFTTNFPSRYTCTCRGE